MRMKTILTAIAGAAALTAAAIAPVHAEEAKPKTAAPHPLNFMFGEWRGTATGTGRDGKPFTLTQTERVGPMLNGDITVIEGRGYDAAGKLVFNAFAVVSPKRGAENWEIRSYTRGYAGTYPFEPSENGYRWTVPAGPNAVVRYTASFEGNRWHQTGERIVEGGKPQQIFEMTLKRIGDTAWPAAGAVAPPGR